MFGKSVSVSTKGPTFLTDELNELFEINALLYNFKIYYLQLEYVFGILRQIATLFHLAQFCIVYVRNKMRYLFVILSF